MPVTIRIFDPAMCCATGVCGPSVEPELARFAADVDWLKKQGVQVERYNLSSEPAAFASTPGVKEALARGNEVLPLILVDERIASEGSYPSRETLAALAGVVVRKLDVAPKSSGCCPPSTGAATPSTDARAQAKTKCC